MSVNTVNRGRPRSLEAIARDDLVLRLVSESPRTRNELWTIIGYGKVSSSQVYLSLNRLRKLGLIKCCKPEKGDAIWTTDSRCP